MSTTTLLSEVIYMVKMRPKHHLRHSILRESVDAENLTSETEFKESAVPTTFTKFSINSHIYAHSEGLKGIQYQRAVNTSLYYLYTYII